MGKKDNGLEFARDLVDALLSDRDVYSDEVLFRDAVEEVYEILRKEAIAGGREELVGAYETAVLLRALASNAELDTTKLLLEIRKNLG